MRTRMRFNASTRRPLTVVTLVAVVFFAAVALVARPALGTTDRNHELERLSVTLVGEDTQLASWDAAHAVEAR